MDSPNNHHSKRPPTLRDLYPSLTEEELAVVEENLNHYLLLVLEIYENIEKDPVRMERLMEEIRHLED